jgi:acetyl esterase
MAANPLHPPGPQETARLLEALRGGRSPALHPQIEELQRRWAGLPDLGQVGLDEARRLVVRRNELIEPREREAVHEVADVRVPTRAGGIPGRRYRPAQPLGALLFIHGGGWTMGETVLYDSLCRRLANLTGCAVVSIDYRLAPEHRFPEPLDDCLDALDWLARTTDGGPLVVVGDSAGGNLAAVCAVRARDAGGPPIALQVLVYPVTGPDESTDSYRLYGHGGPGSSAARAAYLGPDVDPRTPDAAPLLAELAGLPPAVVVVAEHDVLRDDGLAYAVALDATGVPVGVDYYPDMPHGFWHRVHFLDRAGESVERVSGVIRASARGESDALAGLTPVRGAAAGG